MPALHRAMPVLTLSVCTLLTHCGGEDESPRDPQDSGVPDSGSDDGGVGQGGGDNEDAGDRDAGAHYDSGQFGPYDAGHDAGPEDAGPGGTMYMVTLSTAAESPVCASAGPVATGIANLWIDPSETWMSVWLTYENLSSAPTMGHIHFGTANVNGPIVLSLGSDLNSPIMRTLNASNYYAAQSAPVSFAAFVAELKAGKAYFNLHTESCPSGEIRGQIQ
jgi:hypothetical protein